MKHAPTFHTWRSWGLALALLAALALAVAPAVWGQTSPAPAPAAKAEDASKLDRSDRKMLEELAQGNMAEIDAGKMALEKSQSAEVKKFAQQMVDEHTKALGEVQALATAKNVTLPDGAGAMAKTRALALKALSGNLFDTEYARRAGVGDHESTVKLLQKMQKDGRDSDLKALAGKMLPTVEHHLDMAKALAASTASASARKS
jgi:putative membrane protein